MGSADIIGPASKPMAEEDNRDQWAIERDSRTKWYLLISKEFVWDTSEWKEVRRRRRRRSDGEGK